MNRDALSSSFAALSSSFAALSSSFAALSLSLAALTASGCSDPTLEEACADYCEAIESAGCDSPTAKECSEQCDGIREQLNGKCIEEYTDTFDCGAGLDFECRDGRAVNTDGGCLEEAFDLLECTGLGLGGDETSSTDPASTDPESGEALSPE